MRHFLFALELGGNLGHLARCLPLARRLRERGHTVLFAVPNSKAAVQMLVRDELLFVESPRIAASGHPARLPINYSDMLLQVGYRDAIALQGAVLSWLNLFQIFKPDVVVADHAPTALLAARIAGLPPVALGSGFEIPPQPKSQGEPLPSMRPWEEISAIQLAKADAELLANINAVLRTCRQPCISSVFELFGYALRMLATFPELDHYGVRQGEHYAGVFYGAETRESAESVVWPQGTGPRVLVYFRPAMQGFMPLLKVLSASNFRVVFAAPGTNAKHVARFSGPHMRFSHQTVAFAPLLPDADLAISYGSIGFTTQVLRTGVPLLMVPQLVEQKMCTQRVEALGAGAELGAIRDEAECQRLFGTMHDQRFGTAARDFANRYQIYSESSQTDAIALKIIACA